MSKCITALAIAASLLVCSLSLNAQDDLSPHWNGVWNAEGTLFTMGIQVENDILKVTQIESMGFEWTNQDGKIEGNIVQVEIEYAGTIDIIQAELIDANTVVAFALSCTPEYMVVCLLAKDRRAIFKKVESN